MDREQMQEIEELRQRLKEDVRGVIFVALMLILLEMFPIALAFLLVLYLCKTFLF